MPFVSVVLPFRNAAGTISEAVQSILSQDFRDIELIAVDDGSSDGSADCISNIEDSRLCVCRNNLSDGVVGASATGFSQAKGEWIARMDADDVAMPSRISRQLEVIKPNTGVVTCGVKLIESFGEGMTRYVEWVNSLSNHDEMSRSRFIESPVVNPTAIVRRDWMAREGGYHDPSWAEDHDLWLRLLDAGCRFDKVPEVLLHWRDSPDRLTRRDPRYGNEARSRMRAHYIARIARVRENGVVIAGAGPIGKRLALDLQSENIQVRGFFEVSSRRIGQKIHGAEVAAVNRIGSDWSSSVLLGAVGLAGAREEVRQIAISAGRQEGDDFWSAC